jgi:hypothetical protein
MGWFRDGLWPMRPGCRPGHDPAHVITGSRHRCQTAARRTRRSTGCARITTEAVCFRHRSIRRLGARLSGDLRAVGRSQQSRLRAQ